MRVIRSLMMLAAVALLAAGCAAQPVAYVQMAPGANGLDAMAYGSPAAVTYAYPQTYAAAYPQGYGAAYPHAAYPQQQVYAGYQPAPQPPQPSSPGLFNSTVTPPARTYAAAPAVAAYAPTAQPPYTLDAGDRLRITVFGQDGLTNAYVVGATGYIAMPLIGQVMARGLTTDQLSARIAEKLKDGFIREPHVAVEIEAYRPFFILGEVTQPGQYPYVANMTAETAVAIAGGFTPRASRSAVTLTRTVNGQQVRAAVPLNYELRPGDTINVQERWF
jgi:polysaccharide biosynthesis/export protein